MKERLAEDLERWADKVENGELICPDEMNCAAVMRLAAEALRPCQVCNGSGEMETGIGMMMCDSCKGEGRGRA